MLSRRQYQVNLKMCFEGMEESGSEGLDELISEEKDKFFKGVDCVCISGELCVAGLSSTMATNGIASPPSITDNYCTFIIALLGIVAALTHKRISRAQHHDPVLDLRAARYRLLQDLGLWPRSRSPLGRYVKWIARH
jgi:hypothetical protein